MTIPPPRDEAPIRMTGNGKSAQTEADLRASLHLAGLT